MYRMLHIFTFQFHILAFVQKLEHTDHSLLIAVHIKTQNRISIVFIPKTDMVNISGNPSHASPLLYPNARRNKTTRIKYPGCPLPA